jgi:hypothetical protein
MAVAILPTGLAVPLALRGTPMLFRCFWRYARDIVSETSAELSSMAATVEDLVNRLGRIGGTYEEAHRDDLVADVQEAERALQAALRRLNRLSGSAGA